jgi:hypothetical protein
MKIFKTWTFKWWEVALLKLCMTAFGIILALSFHSYLIGLMGLWWAVFILTILYFIPKVFRKE